MTPTRALLHAAAIMRWQGKCDGQFQDIGGRSEPVCMIGAIQMATSGSAFKGNADSRRAIDAVEKFLQWDRPLHTFSDRYREDECLAALLGAAGKGK